MTDPFGRAIHDFHRDEQDSPLIQRDGGWAREHPIEAFYFGDFDDEDDRSEFITSWVEARCSTWVRARDVIPSTFRSASRRSQSK
jgi:hypothetical protein